MDIQMLPGLTERTPWNQFLMTVILTFLIIDGVLFHNDNYDYGHSSWTTGLNFLILCNFVSTVAHPWDFFLSNLYPNYGIPQGSSSLSDCWCLCLVPPFHHTTIWESSFSDSAHRQTQTHTNSIFSLTSIDIVLTLSITTVGIIPHIHHPIPLFSVEEAISI